MPSGTALDAPLTALRQASAAASAAVPMRQNEFNGATAAKAASDKALAEKTPVCSGFAGAAASG